MTRLVLGLVAVAYVLSIVLGYVLPLVLPRVESISAAFVLGCLATVIAGDVVDQLRKP